MSAGGSDFSLEGSEGPGWGLLTVTMAQEVEHPEVLSLQLLWKYGFLSSFLSQTAPWCLLWVCQ